MKVTYEACHLTASKSTPTKRDFPTWADAEKYIRTCICSQCLAEVKKGYKYYSSVKKEKEVRVPICNALDTLCGAEWIIIRVEGGEDNENKKMD